MIRHWDFETCPSCGRAHRDEVFDGERVPETIGCECGQRVGWARHRRNHIHESIGSLYQRGQVDPQTGVDYQSYGHKKQTLREMGREEGEIERIDDIMNDHGEDTGVRNPDVGVLDAGSDEEAVQELRDKLFRRGDVDRRESGNPNRPMQDSWVKF